MTEQNTAVEADTMIDGIKVLAGETLEQARARVTEGMANAEKLQEQINAAMGQPVRALPRGQAPLVDDAGNPRPDAVVPPVVIIIGDLRAEYATSQGAKHALEWKELYGWLPVPAVPSLSGQQTAIREDQLQSRRFEKVTTPW